MSTTVGLCCIQNPSGVEDLPTQHIIVYGYTKRKAVPVDREQPFVREKRASGG